VTGFDAIAGCTALEKVAILKTDGIGSLAVTVEQGQIVFSVEGTPERMGIRVRKV